MKNSILVLLAMLLMASLAYADNIFTLGTGYQWVTLNGNWVAGGVSGSTLNGVAVGDVFCISPDAESYLGTSWPVTVSSPKGLLQEEEAVLVMDEELVASLQNQYEQNVFTEARWDLADPGSGATLTGLPAGADSSLLAWLPTVVNDYNYSGVKVYTPFGSGVGNQTFESGLATLIPPPQSPTPEPATWLMLLGGASLLGAGVRFRNRTA
jgi:hypothetical protein